MDIKTKYSIGDAVYILDGYHIQRANIAGIGIDVTGNHVNITYRFAVFPMKKEKECFATRESLIKFLTK